MYTVTPQSGKGSLAIVAHRQLAGTDHMRWLRSSTFGLSAVVVVLLLIGTASAQLTERRVALVIGNGTYRHVSRLANPTSDARLMAETLTAVGFTLVGGMAQLDLDKPAFDRTVQEFSSAIQGAGVALFYYAGHGVQVRGANYLVPVNANPTREAEVDFQMFNTELVLRQMELAGTRLNLLILDACRNNPFAGRGLRTAGGGLAQMQAPEGTLIAFATQPGNVAQDGGDGHSPYTTALANAFRKPGLDLFAVFNETGLDVKKRTGGAQQPWVSSSPIAGQFYFTGVPDPQPAGPTRHPPATTGGTDDAVEIAFWNSVKDATNPEALHAYLQQYPQGKFARLATLKLKELTTPPPPAPQVPAEAARHSEPLAPPQQDSLFTGSTLRWFGLTIWDNAQAHTFCRTECANDANCRGYTFVVIGGFNPNEGPVCYLLSKIETTVSNRCCISAHKSASPQ